MMSDSGWIVEMGGLELGPIPLDELEAMIHAGEVQFTDRVRRPDSIDWLHAESVFVEGAAKVKPSSVSNEIPFVDEAPVVFAPGQKAGPVDVTAVDQDKHDQPNPDAEQNSLENEEDAHEALSVGENQFMVQIDDDEIGPLPWETVVQMGRDGRLTPDSLIRLEHEADWQTASELGFRLPKPDSTGGKKSGRAQEPEAESDSPVSVPLIRRFAAGALGGVMFPIDVTTAAFRSMARWSIRMQLAALAGGAVLVFVTTQLIASWSQTALTATITLNGDPLPRVIVTLTGMSTGEMGVGVSDGRGRVNVLNREGHLSDGSYHVTVNEARSNGEKASSGRSRIPSRYLNLSTTSLTIEVHSSREDYEIELTSDVRDAIFDSER